MTEKPGPDCVPSIPKIIHYVWVGGTPLPPSVVACVASWQKHLPGYEFKLWNETNSPMTHPYVQAMYAQKKWAFVSDYIRFWALDREGGIYLDTDMEVFKSLDRFLGDVPGFLGRSKAGDVESSIIGAVAGAPFIKAALRFYDHDKDYSIANTSPLVLANCIASSTEKSPTVYDYSYFHPCDAGEACREDVVRNAYARHHWAETWVPFATLRKLMRRLGIMPLLKIIKKFIT